MSYDICIYIMSYVYISCHMYIYHVIWIYIISYVYISCHICMSLSCHMLFAWLYKIFSCIITRESREPPKNGLIALWPSTNEFYCHICMSLSCHLLFASYYAAKNLVKPRKYTWNTHAATCDTHAATCVFAWLTHAATCVFAWQHAVALCCPTLYKIFSCIITRESREPPKNGLTALWPSTNGSIPDF